MSTLSLAFNVLLKVKPTMVYELIKKQMSETLPFVRLLGISIDSIGPGTAEVSMPDDAKLHNHLGTPHAGALFTLAETASRRGHGRRLRGADHGHASGGQGVAHPVPESGQGRDARLRPRAWRYRGAQGPAEG
ncbi:PaaI family thioesterase [Pseudoduganella sp. UC29_106]|uniref:PaaI family thioesterase n=1 Tax=Pseudoduganella sp. UC29_106 TaxID=3374553 RepID=UPI003756B172